MFGAASASGRTTGGLLPIDNRDRYTPSRVDGVLPRENRRRSALRTASKSPDEPGYRCRAPPADTNRPDRHASGRRRRVASERNAADRAACAGGIEARKAELERRSVSALPVGRAYFLLL